MLAKLGFFYFQVSFYLIFGWLCKTECISVGDGKGLCGRQLPKIACCVLHTQPSSLLH